MFENTSYTKWHNPTQHTLRFSLFVSDRQPRRPFVVEPGKNLFIPSELDRGVQEVTADGVVVGGMAPQLVNKGKFSSPVEGASPDVAPPPETKLHAALDHEAQAKQAADEKVVAEGEKAAMIAAAKLLVDQAKASGKPAEKK